MKIKCSDPKRYRGNLYKKEGIFLPSSPLVIMCPFVSIVFVLIAQLLNVINHFFVFLRIIPIAGGGSLSVEKKGLCRGITLDIS